MKYNLIVIVFSLLNLSPAMALTLNGFSEFESVWKLNVSMAGVVQTINVQPGSPVMKGDILLKLDVTTYQARLKRAIAIEKSLLPVQQAAQLELERAEELYDRDSLSQVALKNAENTLAKAEGNLEAASANRIIAEYELANTVISSPVDGHILQLFTNISQFIDPSVTTSPLLTVVNSRRMKAVALINSEQWNDSLINRKATVKYRNKEYSGKVSYLGFKRIKQSGGLPAYEIHVSFEADQFIPAEMPVTLIIKD